MYFHVIGSGFFLVFFFFSLISSFFLVRKTACTYVSVCVCVYMYRNSWHLGRLSQILSIKLVTCRTRTLSSAHQKITLPAPVISTLAAQNPLNVSCVHRLVNVNIQCQVHMISPMSKCVLKSKPNSTTRYRFIRLHSKTLFLAFALRATLKKTSCFL